MAIPKHDEIRVPAMELLLKNSEMKLRDFVEPLSKHFKLSEEEINEMYPSGNGHIFYDRISWALSYLNMGGLLDKPKRGIYKINQIGIDLIKTPEKVNLYIEKQLEKREPSKQKKKSTEEQINIEEIASELTPQERLYSSFSNIRNSVYSDILNTILTKTPTSFEKLVVMLLQKMGYGGEIENSGLVTKVSNDGGIDGIIKEPLGGAHNNQKETFETVKQEILKHLANLKQQSPEQRIDSRIEKFSSMGVVHDLETIKE